MIYIVNKYNKPLMPTNRHSHIRKLIKQGKAVVISSNPYIVKLKYEPINKSEPTSLSSSPIDLKDWANIALCDKLFKSILDYEN